MNEEFRLAVDKLRLLSEQLDHDDARYNLALRQILSALTFLVSCESSRASEFSPRDRGYLRAKILGVETIADD